MEILHFNPNSRATLLSVGTSQGFFIMNLLTQEILMERRFAGGIGPIDIFESTNLMALSGGGLFPQFPTTKI